MKSNQGLSGALPFQRLFGKAADADNWLLVRTVNAEGVTVYGRLSLDVLRPMMRLASRDLCAWHKTVARMVHFPM